MKKTLSTLLLLGAITASANAAVLVSGTEIGVDFGPNTTAPGGNFNSITSLTSIAAGSVIDTSGVVVDGVGFSLTSSDLSPFINDGADETQSSLPSVFDSTHTTDWIGTANDATTHTLTLTFTGLNDSFTYDLIIGGAGGAAGVADTSWLVDGETLVTAASTAGSSFVTFTGLSTNGSGSLVMVGTGVGSRTDIATVSALHLTAVPEPSSFALLAGLFGLAHIMLRRRG